jgi:DNA-binding NarL/FixJ family response regulator
LFEAAGGDCLEALYIVAVTAGLRRSELQGLRWDDRTFKPGCSRSDARSPSRRAATSSRLQVRVAAMVARGMSNRQIASELYHSERTVENHLSRSLSKLGLTSRAEVAAWTTEQRLLILESD